VNSSLYDDPELYNARSEPEPFASFYTAIAREFGGPLLELGCGTGQITVPIAQAGIETVGLDISPPMLDAAKAYAAKQGVEVRWVQDDMRTFSLGQRFSVVIIVRNSLLQLTDVPDLRTCLGSIRRHLLPEGRFVFDIFNPDVRILASPPERRLFVRKFSHPVRGDVTLELTSDYDAASQVNRGTWHHSTVEEPDFLTVPLHLRSIFPQELPLLLESEGLRLENRWGSFAREQFGGGSRLQVCCARLA
jgi:SAM-dependent methyltransferase